MRKLEYKTPYFQKGETWRAPPKPHNPNYKDIFPCWECKKDVEVKYAEPKERVFCEECDKRRKKEHDELILEYAQLKTKVMFENAIRIMEKSKKVYLHECLDASKEIYEMALEDTERFMSAYEMVVAIALEEYGYEFQANMPLLTYKVDFYIPELRVCLEVDGAHHEYKIEYDSKRDIEIRKALGAEWEVVRIPTKYIDQNPSKIIDGIEGLAEEKRRLRKKNQGYVPYGFSKRENKLYDNLN